MSSRFSITSASPSGGSLLADTTVTLYGSGLQALFRGIYKPRYSIRLVVAASDSEATITLPCRTMGAGVHRLTFTLQGSNAEFTQHGQVAVSSEQPGLRFVCFSEPRFTALRPVVGPSWQGSAITLTTTMVNCPQPDDQLHRCNPPPLDILERMDTLSTAGFGTGYPRTSNFGRCRWLCQASFGCFDADFVDVYGPMGNVSETTATCLLPPELNGHEGHVEVRTARSSPLRDGRQTALPSR
jgi:hypothetical protein